MSTSDDISGTRGLSVPAPVEDEAQHPGDLKGGCQLGRNLPE
jgi:hypothetical protein